MAKVGYARVSTEDQHPEAQIQRLEAAGCEKVFAEVISSGAKVRPELVACLAYLRPGDALVTVRLDRLARSTRQLLEIGEDLQGRGVDLIVLDQAIDTTTPAGRLMFALLGAIAEFERDLIRERTMDGLARARSEGRVGGRKPTITGAKARMARAMAEQGESVRSIATALSVSHSAVHRHLKANAETTQKTVCLTQKKRSGNVADSC
jgi:DNA invertase Pin-like site-specific DNA recombinase